MFAVGDHWLWDFSLADRAEGYHLFFHKAPKSLRDTELRHRNVGIGHATSRDLASWEEREDVLSMSPAWCRAGH